MTLITNSVLPLQLVETSGFKKFMKIVDPKYVVPSRRIVARKLVDSVESIINQTKSELQRVMAQGNAVHFTMDLWSSRAMEPIAGIRMHYFNEKFEIKVKTACYRHFEERHTGENIAAVFRDALDNYGIELAQAGYQVTDNVRRT